MQAQSLSSTVKGQWKFIHPNNCISLLEYCVYKSQIAFHTILHIASLLQKVTK
jgi:hypothetical protein